MQALVQNTEVARWIDQGGSFLKTNHHPVKETPCDFIHIVGDRSFLDGESVGMNVFTQVKVIAFSTVGEYLSSSDRGEAACVLINGSLPNLCEIKSAGRHDAKPQASLMFFGDRIEPSSAVAALKAGTVDFFVLPKEASFLQAAIQAAIAHDRKRKQRVCELAGLQRRFLLLTPRERDVLPLVIGGFLNKQAAAELGISEVTLQIHRSHIMQKTEASSLAELVRMAVKLRIPHRCI